MEKTSFESTAGDLPAVIQQAVALAVREQAAPILSALEALQDQQTAFLQMLSGEDRIGQAAARYYEKMAVMHGGTL